MYATVSSPDRHEETDRIDSFSVQIQEYAIIEDLLYILLVKTHDLYIYYTYNLTACI